MCGALAIYAILNKKRNIDGSGIELDKNGKKLAAVSSNEPDNCAHSGANDK